MREYRAIIMFLLLSFCFILIVGCKANTPEETFVRAQKALNSLKNYSTRITYIVADGEEKREYRFRQWVSMPHSFKISLIEPDNLTGKVIKSDGKEILIKHPKIGDSIKFSVKSLERQRPLFIGDFLSSFWLSEDVGKKIHVDKDVEYVVFTCPTLESTISGGSQELWLGSPKMVPIKMLIYDRDKNITSSIYFEEFDKGWKPEENFFSLED